MLQSTKMNAYLTEQLLLSGVECITTNPVHRMTLSRCLCESIHYPVASSHRHEQTLHIVTRSSGIMCVSQPTVYYTFFRRAQAYRNSVLENLLPQYTHQQSTMTLVVSVSSPTGSQKWPKKKTQFRYVPFPATLVFTGGFKSLPTSTIL